jgi:hypothetical protein
MFLDTVHLSLTPAEVHSIYGVLDLGLGSRGKSPSLNIGAEGFGAF